MNQKLMKARIQLFYIFKVKTLIWCLLTGMTASGGVFLWIIGTIEWLEDIDHRNPKIVTLLLIMCLHFVIFTLLTFVWRKEIKEYILLTLQDEEPEKLSPIVNLQECHT
jgi:hypothetical protein